jgi:hypothetical protein
MFKNLDLGLPAEAPPIEPVTGEKKGKKKKRSQSSDSDSESSEGYLFCFFFYLFYFSRRKRERKRRGSFDSYYEFKRWYGKELEKDYDVKLELKKQQWGEAFKRIKEGKPGVPSEEEVGIFFFFFQLVEMGFFYLNDAVDFKCIS